MVVNKNFIFVHVPKTGGTSIRSLIEDYAMGRTEEFSEEHDVIFSAYQQMPDENFNSKFKFAFVRNPFDRELSNYFWHTKMNGHIDISFPDWVKWRYDEMSDFLSVIQFSEKSDYYYQKGFAKTPQIGFLINEKGKIIVDFVGRFETLQEDWDIVADRLGLPKSLPHEFKTYRDQDYRKYYTEETRSIIENAHSIDLEIFNYDFDKGLVDKKINGNIDVKVHLFKGYNYYYG